MLHIMMAPRPGSVPLLCGYISSAPFLFPHAAANAMQQITYVTSLKICAPSRQAEAERIPFLGDVEPLSSLRDGENRASHTSAPSLHTEQCQRCSREVAWALAMQPQRWA